MNKARNPNASIILITGTSRGIGHYLAKYFLESGDIVIGCSRSNGTIEHENYEHLSLDISRDQDISSLFSYIRKRFKKLDVLINNAAINPALGFSVLSSSSTIERSFETNVVAVMKTCKEAVKLMARNKRGRIINFGSMAVKLEIPGESVYTATKAAINAYTKVLSKEVYALGITVNCVAPSAIRTDLSAQIDQSALKEVLSRNAIPDYGEMEDVSNLIAFLVSDRSKAITGQIIYLGGV